MKLRSALLTIVLIALLAGAASLAAYPSLPDRVPTHWNAAGQIDGYSSRSFAAAFLPILILAISLLLLYLPQIDPLKANIEPMRGRYHLFVVLIAVFLLYVHLLSMLVGVGVPIQMTLALTPAIGLITFAIGFLLDRAQPNWFIGIRTPWTLSNPEVWRKTHRLGGFLFKVCGIVALIGLLFSPQSVFLWVIVPLLVSSLALIVYSYVAFLQQTR